jgi:hypothetical protein
MQKPNMPTPEEISTWSQELSTTVMHPEFLKAIEEISSLPEAQYSQAVFTQLTPQALAARGVPIPEGLRVSTRYFENPDDRTLSATELGTGESDMTGGLTSGTSFFNLCLTIGIGRYCASAGLPRDLDQEP